MSTRTIHAALEPVLQDGLRPSCPSDSLKRTFAASRSIGPAALRELRKIFSWPRFEEIFDGQFEHDPGDSGANLKPTLQIFRDASAIRQSRSGQRALRKNCLRAGFLCLTGFATTIDCRKRGWP